MSYTNPGKENSSGDCKTAEKPVQGPAEKPISAKMQQEALLKQKYRDLPVKGGARLLRHRFNERGRNKYFDSGDYNMARAKMAGAGDQNRGEVTGNHMATLEELPHMRISSTSNLVVPQNQS